jgi:hypothetical protein
MIALLQATFANNTHHDQYNQQSSASGEDPKEEFL